MLLVGAVLVVVVVGVLVDQRVRQRESDRVHACVADAATSVRLASGRVDSIVSYARPALDSGIPPALRRRLHGLISVSVAPAVPDVRRARDRCLRTRVLWFHDGLHATRADCLRLLDRDLAYLSGVVADGSTALGPRRLPAGRCTAP